MSTIPPPPPPPPPRRAARPSPPPPPPPPDAHAEMRPYLPASFPPPPPYGAGAPQLPVVATPARTRPARVLVGVLLAAALLVASPSISAALTDALGPDAPPFFTPKRSPRVEGDATLPPWPELTGAPAWVAAPPGPIQGCFPRGGSLAGPEGSSVTPAFLDRVAAVVEELRDLRFIEDIEPQFLDPEAFGDRLESFNSGASDDDFAALEDVFVALGLLDETRDLKKIVEDDLAGQIIGFYLPREEELYVEAGDGASLTALEEVTLAHELEHALADQVLGLPLDDRAPALKGDEQAATRALIEGDASLVTQHYIVRALDIGEQSALGSDPEVSEGPGDDVPHFLQRSLSFPYVEGLMFVCELYRRGGWRAIDAAYKDPPVSTAQIMYPLRYLRGDDPVEVAPLGSPGKGWTRGRPNVLSASDLLFFFEHPGTGSGEWTGRDQASELAALWAGGRLDHWARRGDISIGISLAQHRGYPAGALCPVMIEWYRAARPASRLFPGSLSDEEHVRLREPGQVALFECGEQTVKIAIAPSQRLALEIIGWGR